MGRTPGGYVDLELVSDDAIYRDGEGTEHIVERVTQDLDLARRITEIAAAVAAGATVFDDSNAPALTVLADQERQQGGRLRRRVRHEKN